MNKCEKSAFRLKSVLWVLPVTIVLVMGMLPGGVAYAAECTVNGVTQPPGTNPVRGTAGPDIIDCSSARAGRTIAGGGGDDTITGSAFSDTISGGGGNDNISGGAGNDTISGGAGNDNISGGAGTDTISGGGGDDTLSGPPDDSAVDNLNGGAGTDTCASGGRDRLAACELSFPPPPPPPPPGPNLQICICNDNTQIDLCAQVDCSSGQAQDEICGPVCASHGGESATGCLVDQPSCAVQ